MRKITGAPPGDCNDPSGKNQRGQPSSEQMVACEVERIKVVGANVTDELLVTVLRVFAARGRAIREAGSRHRVSQLESTPTTQEIDGQNQ